MINLETQMQILREEVRARFNQRDERIDYLNKKMDDLTSKVEDMNIYLMKYIGQSMAVNDKIQEHRDGIKLLAKGLDLIEEKLKKLA